MNLKEGLQKGLEIYANQHLNLELGMNTTDYTYEFDFSDDSIVFHMPHNLLWSSYYSDINEIKRFLNNNVKDSYYFGDFVKEAFEEAKNEKLYGSDIYGKIQTKIIRAEKEGVEPLLLSDEYKTIIDLINEHRQLEKDKNISKNKHEYERE
jgi:hypothetical protein